MAGSVARAQVEIEAPVHAVWAALTDPAKVAVWMVGTTLDTTWERGAPIVWRGEYEGKAYEDKGEVIQIDPPTRLVVTHYSPLMGEPDMPASYHTVTYDLHDLGDSTRVELTQDGCADEAQATMFSTNWDSMLRGVAEAV